MQELKKTLNVFIIYAREDKDLVKKMEIYITPLLRKGKIKIWSDEKILPGEDWKKKINVKMVTSDVIFLILSPNFIASDYINEIELPTALELHETNEVPLIPILMKSCNWESLPLNKLQLIPRNTKPIARINEREEESAFHEASLEIEQRISSIINYRSEVIGNYKQRVESLIFQIKSLQEQKRDHEHDLQRAKEIISMANEVEDENNKLKKERHVHNQIIKSQMQDIDNLQKGIKTKDKELSDKEYYIKWLNKSHEDNQSSLQFKFDEEIRMLRDANYNHRQSNYLLGQNSVYMTVHIELLVFAILFLFALVLHLVNFYNLVFTLLLCALVFWILIYKVYNKSDAYKVTYKRDVSLLKTKMKQLRMQVSELYEGMSIMTKGAYIEVEKVVKKIADHINESTNKRLKK